MRIPTNCIACGSIFIAKTTVTKYCSKKCVKAEMRRKKREAMTGSADLLYHNKCKECNKVFSSKTTLANFCSEKCINRDQKKKIREKKISTATAIKTHDSMPSSETKESLLSHTSKEFYSIKEFANTVGVHERTIMNHVWKNQLPHSRIGRRILINKIEVINFVRKK